MPPKKKSNKGKSNKQGKPFPPGLSKKPAKAKDDLDELELKSALDANLNQNNHTDTNDLSDSRENSLKLSEWTQDAYTVDVVLFAGKKLKSNDVDLECSETDARVRTTDGRQWHCKFFRNILPDATKVQLKGMKILLKVKKKFAEIHWLDLKYLPGQSDKPLQPPSSPRKSPKSFSSEPSLPTDPLQQKHKTTASVNKQTNQSNSKATASVNKQTNQSNSTSGLRETQSCQQVPAAHKSDEEEIEQVITAGAKKLNDLDELKPSSSDEINVEEKVQVTNLTQEENSEVKVDSEEEIYELSLVKSDFIEKSIEKEHDCIVVTLYIKDIVRESVDIRVEGKELTAFFKTRDTKFLGLYKGTSDETLFKWHVTVVSDLDEKRCRFKLYKVKLELELLKVQPKRWNCLEYTQSRENFSVKHDWQSPASSTATQSSRLPDDPVPGCSGLQKRTFKPQQQDMYDDDDDDDDVGPVAAAASRSSSVTALPSSSSESLKPTACVQPFQEKLYVEVPEKAGYTGLDNLGNTCFMSSILQALANCTELRDYFLSGQFQREINHNNPLGTGGKVAVEFATLLRILWSGNRTSYAPTNLKKLIAQRKAMYVGYAQHDAQEYMSYLLDSLHEDVNRIHQKPYIEQRDSDGRPDHEVADEAWSNYKKRNDSQLVDIFQGQYKSTLICPECNKVSVTFDPFMHLAVPLPKKLKVIKLFFFYADFSRRPQKISICIPKDSVVGHLKHEVSHMTQVKIDKLIVYEVYKNKVLQFFENHQPISNITQSDVIVMQELLADEDDEESILYICVLQYALRPLNQPSACSYCALRFEENQKPRRCTGCYRAAYCNRDCQQMDWYQHRMRCKSTPEMVGAPFYLSIPASQATYSCIAQQAEARARWSIDIFQPPVIDHVTTSPSVSSSPPSYTEHPRDEDTSDSGRGSDLLSSAEDDHPPGSSRGAGGRQDEETGEPRSVSMASDQRSESSGGQVSGSTSSTSLGEEEGPGNGQQAGSQAQVIDCIEIRSGEKKDASLVNDHQETARKDASQTDEPMQEVDLAETAKLPGENVEAGKSLNNGEAAKRPTSLTTATDNATAQQNQENGDISTEEAGVSRRASTPDPQASPSRQSEESRNKNVAFDELPEPGHQQRPTSTMSSAVDSAFTDNFSSQGETSPRPSIIEATQPMPSRSFYLAVSTQDASSDLDKYYEDLGDDPLPLNGMTFMAMIWKNDMKVASNVILRSKELDGEDFPGNEEREEAEHSKTSLEQCLKLFTEVEVLGSEEAWYCPQCKAHQVASKQMSLWRLPPVLIIQLKRFSYRGIFTGDKVDKHIEYPITGLDLTEFLHRPLGPNEDPPTYDLFAVVNHYGHCLGGHYTAYVQTLKANKPMETEIGWRLCDDSHVEDCHNLQKIITPAAYVLFYRRRQSVIPLPPHVQAAAVKSDTSVDSLPKDEELEDENEAPASTMQANSDLKKPAVVEGGDSPPPPADGSSVADETSSSVDSHLQHNSNNPIGCIIPNPVPRFDLGAGGDGLADGGTDMDAVD